MGAAVSGAHAEAREAAGLAGVRIQVARAAGVAGAGLGLLVIGLLFDSSPLLVPAVGLIVIGIIAPLWVLATARGASVLRRLPTDRVVEDHPLAATIEVRRGWLGVPGAEVEDPFTGAHLDVSAALSLTQGSRAAGIRVVSRFPRRGLQRLPQPRLLIADPLQLARVEGVGAGTDQQLLVLPAVEAVRWTASGQGRRLELPDAGSPAEALAATDLEGLRPYRPGAPASRIHWPALARGHGLIERRLQADGDGRPLVVVDARLGGAPTAETERWLDAVVRAAASLTLELARAGGCGLLLPGDQRPTVVDRELNHWPGAHGRLALIQSSGARAPMLAQAGGRLGAIVYVGVRPPARLAGQMLASGGAVVLVLPTPSLEAGRPPGIQGSAQPVLSVSGCTGFRLGARRARQRRGSGERVPA
jgi:uncharacterized protein (DUF58 family)